MDPSTRPLPVLQLLRDRPIGIATDAAGPGDADRLAQHEQVLGELLQLVSALMRHTGCPPPRLRRPESLRDLAG